MTDAIPWIIAFGVVAALWIGVMAWMILDLNKRLVELERAARRMR